MYSGQNPSTSAKISQGLKYSGNTCGVDAFCINVEGSVHDCTLGQCSPETGSGVGGVCASPTPREAVGLVMTAPAGTGAAATPNPAIPLPCCLPLLSSVHLLPALLGTPLLSLLQGLWMPRLHLGVSAVGQTEPQTLLSTVTAVSCSSFSMHSVPLLYVL